MDSIEFVSRYPEYLEQLEKVLKPEYKEVIDTLKARGPHDLVCSEHDLNSEAEAVGFVFRRFLKKMAETH